LLKAALAVAATMMARGLAALGGALLSIVVARLAGAEGLGQFAVFLSLLGALAILARHGKDMLLIRAVAWAEGRADAATSVALLGHGALRVAGVAVVLGLGGSALLASGWLGTAFTGTVALMPLALLLLTLLALVSGYAKGRSRAWLAPLFEIGGISMVAALILAGTAFLITDLGEAAIAGAFLAALGLLILMAGAMLWRDMPVGAPLPRLEPAQKAELRSGQVDFTLIALATFLTQAGSFVLAAPFLTEADLGLMRAAERLALLVSFPMLAINPVIAPRIVQLSRGGDAAGLRRLTLRALVASTGIAACVLLPLLIFPERALALMGAEFAAAVPYLRLMAVAQFLAAVIGPLAMMLTMSGRERVSMWINLGTLALAFVLVPSLSMAHGASGFALAYASIIVTRLGLIGAVVFLTGPAVPCRTGARK